MKTRIEAIMQEKKLTPTEFADKISLNPSIMSHIMSGRNKPSLDVVTRILRVFEDINPSWMILGDGDMWNEAVAKGRTTPSSPPKEKETSLFSFENEVTEPEPIEKIESTPIPAAPSLLERKLLASVSSEVAEVAPPPPAAPPVVVAESVVSPAIAEIQAALPSPTRKVDRIVLFYSDKTYQNFISEE